MLYYVKGEVKIKFDIVFVNPPFNMIPQFEALAKNKTNRHVHMIAKASHMSDVTMFKQNKISSFVNLGHTAFKEAIEIISYSHDRTIDDDAPINVSGHMIKPSDIFTMPSQDVDAWIFTQRILKLRLEPYEYREGKLYEQHAEPQSGGLKCIWRCGFKGKDFIWSEINNRHQRLTHGYGRHKIIMSHNTSIGKSGQVKYAPPEYAVACVCLVMDSKEECLEAIEHINSPLIKKLMIGIKTSVVGNSWHIWRYIPHHKSAHLIK